MTTDTVDRVRECIAEVLARDTGEIEARSRLIDDLGADSLDLVELMYLLEEAFAVKLDKKDLSLSAQLGLAEEELHVNEVLTDRALELLRERFPDDHELLVEGATRSSLAGLLTVAELARAVDRRLAVRDQPALAGS